MSNKKTLSSEEVTAYLLENRDFFEQHPDSLSALNVPHNAQGASSLIERQVTQLREHNEHLRHRIAELLENARNNDQLFEKTRKLSLLLNKGFDFTEQVNKLRQSLAEDFNAECYSLILFDKPAVQEGDFLQTIASETAQKQAPGLMGIKHVFCGHLREQEYQFLFPNEYKNIHSAIVIPIKEKNLHGFIALGSVDKNRFHPKLGTLFAEYIGNMVGGSLANALALSGSS
ncbi:MAG: DUF484 family protein [Pseudomonadales bacterium]|nr:DUF484 family protein [Pseudomonadales bacterium]